MEQEFKPDTTAAQITIHRGTEGLTISVRVNERIEGFFRRVSQGIIEEYDLRVVNKVWNPKDGSNVIKLYQISHERNLFEPTFFKKNSVRGFRLDAVGRRILDFDPTTGEPLVNISFLRIVGLSEKDFIFTVAGVYGELQVKLIYNSIVTAINEFCATYLSPITLTINLVES